MVNKVKELSDTNLTDNILNIGRRRERHVYYRPDGTPTGELPADTYSQIYYQKKGFTMYPPIYQKDIVEGELKCPLCSFTGENALSLRTHLNKHVNENKNKEET